ncbi:hypothetical protein NQ318_002535 [Aromia moschata]|uniref:Uncharacterized protein n=1 Tax=Aromia moschata TaxID=1265417 RepID=A0AAV8Y5J4_9CUCU|nr:hypothetical protein NQ318_002535 [Aromia moschata]
MWHRPHHHQQQCGGGSSSGGGVDHGQACAHRGGASLHEHQHQQLPVGWHHSAPRFAPQSPPLQQSQRALLHFPPPPSYPPPFPSTSKMAAEEHFLSVAGPSSQADPQPWPSMDYSYAYYEPGPPTKHTNVPSKYPGAYREGTYRTRHTYLTRYGTEENIYEEIGDIARARRNHHRNQVREHALHQDSIASLHQSLVEEEVRRVQSGHRRVLGELNLSVEAMLMPSNSREGSDDTDRENETDDQLADLLTVGPTDELLSPVPLGADLDSGFSGSSSGASYRSAAGSLRRGPERPKSSSNSLGAPRTASAPQGVAGEPPPHGKGFWGKKAWKKIAAFPSNISLNKSKVYRQYTEIKNYFWSLWN